MLSSSLTVSRDCMEYSLVERSDKRMESSLPKQGKEVLRDRDLVGGPGGGLSRLLFKTCLSVMLLTSQGSMVTELSVEQSLPVAMVSRGVLESDRQSEEGFQSVLHNSNSTALSNQGGFHMSDMQGQGKEARLFTQGVLNSQSLGMDPMVLREVKIFRQEPYMLGARRVSLCMVQQQR